ncbi:hypothetical protein ACJJH9_00260 (plasmid) [Microbulbifer sp. DLAB2-AF]
MSKKAKENPIPKKPGKMEFIPRKGGTRTKPQPEVTDAKAN